MKLGSKQPDMLDQTLNAILHPEMSITENLTCEELKSSDTVEQKLNEILNEARVEKRETDITPRTTETVTEDEDREAAEEESTKEPSSTPSTGTMEPSLSSKSQSEEATKDSEGAGQESAASVAASTSTSEKLVVGEIDAMDAFASAEAALTLAIKATQSNAGPTEVAAASKTFDSTDAPEVFGPPRRIKHNRGEARTAFDDPIKSDSFFDETLDCEIKPVESLPSKKQTSEKVGKDEFPPLDSSKETTGENEAAPVAEKPTVVAEMPTVLASVASASETSNESLFSRFFSFCYKDAPVHEEQGSGTYCCFSMNELVGNSFEAGNSWEEESPDDVIKANSTLSGEGSVRDLGMYQSILSKEETVAGVDIIEPEETTVAVSPIEPTPIEPTVEPEGTYVEPREETKPVKKPRKKLLKRLFGSVKRVTESKDKVQQPIEQLENDAVPNADESFDQGQIVSEGATFDVPKEKEEKRFAIRRSPSSSSTKKKSKTKTRPLFGQLRKESLRKEPSLVW